MQTIVYSIEPDSREQEIAWLKEQKIFPSVTNMWDWSKSKPMLRVGVIVSNEAALAIKLRHRLDIQQDYHR